MSSTVRSFAAKTPRIKRAENQQVDVSLIRYNRPIRQDMAILIAFFNPANSFRIVQNLYTVKQMLEMAQIPVYIGEVAYGEVPFVLQSSPTTQQYRTDSIMFYKENILAQLIRNLPETFTKVVLLDADILFVDPDWYKKVSDALDIYAVVQPFRYAMQLDITYRTTSTKSSVLSDLNMDTHQGYAWAFCRSWFDEYPLFEYSLIGGGDTIVSKTVLSYIDTTTISMPPHTNTRRAIGASYVDVDIVHLPHGSVQDRQYGSRHEMIKRALLRHDLSHLIDAVYRRPDWMFEWKEVCREDMNNTLLTYFKNRNDDGI